MSECQGIRYQGEAGADGRDRLDTERLRAEHRRREVAVGVAIRTASPPARYAALRRLIAGGEA